MTNGSGEFVWQAQGGSAAREKEAAVSKPPLRCGKKDPWWCQSQGLSTLADLKLMHLCDQVVISARGVDDKVQLAGSTRFARKKCSSYGAKKYCLGDPHHPA